MDSLVYTLFAVAGLLVLVSLLPPLAQRLRLPYTVLLAATGVGIGTLLHVAGRSAEAGGFGFAGDFLVAVGELDLSSQAFLYIFLPVLLFEAALSVDVRRLMDDLGPVLLLAVVAVLMCTALAGLAMYGVWGLWHGEATGTALVVCFLLASIIATTDPAAVVGIFRDIGAPRRLSILVEGESLFNDAAAIVLFTLLLGMLTAGGSMDPVAAGGDFLVKFAGGLAVGWGLGKAIGWLVTPMRNQAQSEITLTVALAYLAFIIGEHYLGVSGVVAVVTAALVMAGEGRTRISPESWEGLENVWSQLGFWANSLIFLLASMLIPPTLLNATWGHLIMLAALILGATAARALVIFGLIPGLTALGAADRISGAYKTVMLWGGLRGAVSLALALAVSENRRVPDDIQDMVAVVVTGFVLFTLFVQGTTLRPLMRLFRLDRLTPVELALRNRVLGLSLSDVRQEVERIARDFRMDPEPALEPLLDRGAGLAQEQLDLDSMGALSAEDRVYIGLSTLARREEELYLGYFRDGVISRLTVQSLGAAVGRLQDGVKTRGRKGYEAAARSILRFGPGMRTRLWLHRRLGLERPLANGLSERFAELAVQRFALQQLLHFTSQRLSPLLGRDTATTLHELLAARLAAVEEAMAALRLQYPAYLRELEARYLVRAGLRFEERTLQELFEETLISREILRDLSRELNQRRRNAEQPPRLDLGLSTQELVAKVPLFAGLAPERVKRIERLLKPRLYVPGELVVRKGDRGDAMYFISSGAVAVRLPGLSTPVRLGSGEFFGEMALVLDQPRNADVEAIAYCQLLVLDRRDFRRLYEEDAEVKAHIDATVARRQAPVPAAPAA
ncbi:cyclic nucleotide-binding domain-containing protein [Aerophototrophica crusticola]|uniref:Cyclic nucleotide-binding domain-containing protein n=1 Tax=Aerophototrophica crusticola TaxID=1709002 RepID=A0A858R8H9_9PROT|nr:cyclic nucleotide-binding domain-containing protein [Rhodospirillaceae bacterium B3]